MLWILSGIAAFFHFSLVYTAKATRKLQTPLCHLQSSSEEATYHSVPQQFLHQLQSRYPSAISWTQYIQIYSAYTLSLLWDHPGEALQIARAKFLSAASPATSKAWTVQDWTQHVHTAAGCPAIPLAVGAWQFLKWQSELVNQCTIWVNQCTKGKVKAAELPEFCQFAYLNLH